jgi:hypothetical protein
MAARQRARQIANELPLYLIVSLLSDHKVVGPTSPYRRLPGGRRVTNECAPCIDLSSFVRGGRTNQVGSSRSRIRAQTHKARPAALGLRWSALRRARGGTPRPSATAFELTTNRKEEHCPRLRRRVSAYGSTQLSHSALAPMSRCRSGSPRRASSLTSGCRERLWDDQQQQQQQQQAAR